MNEMRSIIKQRIALSLDDKIKLSKRRIKDWYYYWSGNVGVSFSGGKDSIVLLHLVRSLFSKTTAYFLNTGLELPEIMDLINETDNCIKIRPKYTFKQVIEKYGYPVISKEVSQKVYDIRHTNSDYLRNKRLYGDEKGHGKLSEKWKFLIDAPFEVSGKCCMYLKKNPAKSLYTKEGITLFIGTKITDSFLRRSSFKTCNQFDRHVPISQPISFWTDEDIWNYINHFNLSYPRVYKYLKGTGCIFCLFGYQNEINFPIDRFDYLKIFHPKLYNYCMNNLGIKDIIKFIRPVIGKKKYCLFDSKYYRDQNNEFNKTFLKKIERKLK